LTLTLLSDPREGVTVDEERRVLDGRAPIADDESRSFEPDRRARSPLGARVKHTREYDDQ
jgi:hypothetical protein